jgi:hypothetical protein
MENEERAVDSSEIKQLGSLVQSRNLFFIPFYGPFLIFVVTQREYVSNAPHPVQILIGITFLAGIYYAYMISDYLGYLEMFAFLQKARKPR